MPMPAPQPRSFLPVYHHGDVVTSHRQTTSGGHRYYVVDAVEGRDHEAVFRCVHAAIGMAQATGSIGASYALDGAACTVTELIRRVAR